MAKHMAPSPHNAPTDDRALGSANSPTQPGSRHMASHAAPTSGGPGAHSASTGTAPGARTASHAAPTGAGSGAHVAPSHATSQQGARRKGGKRSNLISNILIVLGVVLLAVAGFIYFRNEQNYQVIEEKNEQIAEYARVSNDANEAPVVDWAALKAINPDVVGWLQVPGTVVNYPVLQAADNDYYLNHAPDRSDSIGGSVFLDYENTPPGLVDAQTIVYGHHMRNGSQFKQIADMDNQELFDGVHTVWYVTESGPYDLAPLFVYYTNENDTDVRHFDFQSEEEFRAYLREHLDRAVARAGNADAAIQSVRRIFTLSTCNYYDGYGRTILVCGLKNEIPGTPEYEAAQAAQAVAEQPAEAPAEQPAAE